MKCWDSTLTIRYSFPAEIDYSDRDRCLCSEDGNAAFGCGYNGGSV
jgi:hypothetical protein